MFNRDVIFNLLYLIKFILLSIHIKSYQSYISITFSSCIIISGCKSIYANPLDRLSSIVDTVLIPLGEENEVLDPINSSLPLQENVKIVDYN